MQISPYYRSKILKLFNEYAYNEFGSEPEARLPRNGILHIAYTTYGFNDDEDSDAHEIQVDFDLNEMEWKNYIDGELVLEEPADVKLFISDLEVCDFDSVIRNCVDEGYEKYGKEKDGD